MTRLTNARRLQLAGQPWFLDLWERYTARPVAVRYAPLTLEFTDVKFIFDREVDAMAHVGTPALYMHAEPGRKGVDPLAPVVLTPTSKPPFECQRFAVVMPVRL
jgi:hypothetical protein